MICCLIFPDFIFVLGIFTIHLTTKCITFLFHIDNHIHWVGNVKSVESISRINRKSENIGKRSISSFLVPNSRFGNFKPMSEKADPKLIIGFSDNPIPLIRNVGSQPFLPLGYLSRCVQLNQQTRKMRRQWNCVLYGNIFTCFTSPNIIGHYRSGPIPCARSKFNPHGGCQLLPVGRRSRVLGQAIASYWTHLIIEGELNI